MWWKKGVKADILHASKNLIHARISNGEGDPDWYLYCVYGPTIKTWKETFWEFLGDRVNQFGGPWALIGDLNLIMNQTEKLGGHPVTWRKGRILRDFINKVGGIDLGTHGGVYTWTNDIEAVGCIRERVDRALAEVNWLESFPKATVTALQIHASDHSPFLLDLFGGDPKLPQPFCFFEAWTKEGDCEEIVKQAWRGRASDSPNYALQSALGMVCKALRRWSFDVLN